MDDQLLRLLSDADRALGRLDGAGAILPNPDLFVSMYSRKESVLSSQIEGIQASLLDVLEYEVEEHRRGAPRSDVQEVLNHQKAMTYGLERLKSLPLSNRLLGEIHARLMKDVRGQERNPGEFRRMQNWIGPPGSRIEDASFVPPPAHQLQQSMGELEKYIHEDSTTSALVKCGLVHYQFETIHPFEDGNGRMGRLLITFLLSERKALARPLLYLSAFLKEHRAEYYERLNSVRAEDDYEGWIKFFLRGVREVSLEGTETVKKILEMRTEHMALARDSVSSAHAPLLVEHLLRGAVTTPRACAEALKVSYPTGNNLIARFVELGLLEEISGRARDRVFLYRPYIDLLGGSLSP